MWGVINRDPLQLEILVITHALSSFGRGALTLIGFVQFLLLFSVSWSVTANIVFSHLCNHSDDKSGD
jgi:hypothetical protein